MYSGSTLFITRFFTYNDEVDGKVLKKKLVRWGLSRRGGGADCLENGFDPKVRDASV